MTDDGKVYLVGAGPGDPELITLKGLNALRSAEVIIYDRLAPAELLGQALKNARIIDAGKARGSAVLSQCEINALMISEARAGKTVCRLKGGDPLVFGRGGEEALALTDAGIDWTLVPGVSSAIAAPAFSGIPVTHRGVSSSVTIVTGSQGVDPNGSQVNWEAVAKMGGTIVILMGTNRLSEIARTLIELGKPPDSPTAVTQNGSMENQRTVDAPLSEIAAMAKEAGIASPAVVTIGDVVRLRSRIAWHDKLPLFGKRVVVTRARSQVSALAKGLKELGASVVECPMIRTEPLKDTTELDSHLNHLSRYGWAVFASPNSVKQVWKRLHTLGYDSRTFRDSRIAAIGPATVEELRQHGIEPDLVPADYTSEGLVEAFAECGENIGNTLSFKSDIGGKIIPEALSGLGARVDEVTAYRTVTDPMSKPKALETYSQRIDATTFTSSSTVKNLVESLDGDVKLINSGKVVCIGPKSASAARSSGIRVDAVADEQSIRGVIDAVHSCLTR